MLLHLPNFLRCSFLRALMSVGLVALVASVGGAEEAPFAARRARGLTVNLLDQSRTSPAAWPAEPGHPPLADIERFAMALERACRMSPKGRVLRVAARLVRSAEHFAVDPFLLGGLLVEQSGGTCRTPNEMPEHSVGPTQIQPDLYRLGLSDGVYRYFVLDAEGRWTPKSLPIDRPGRFYRRLLRLDDHLYFAAMFLRGWMDQEASVDATFGQVPHRHFVSHYVWGDRVKSHRIEDRILTARRRLLEEYGATAPLTIQDGDFRLRAPLGGAPRVVTSGLGSPRDEGARRHRGVDFDSLPGEPVFAVAAGIVTFAGVDLPGKLARQQVRLNRYDALANTDLGNGGRFVCLRHARGEATLRTCYMHLQSVAVESGMQVQRGDVLGRVGRTGMKLSAAHLHFEMHDNEGVCDPSEALGALVLRP